MNNNSEISTKIYYNYYYFIREIVLKSTSFEEEKYSLKVVKNRMIVIT